MKKILVVAVLGVVLGNSAARSATWRQVSSGTTQNLWDVDFPQASRGWVVGESSTILHTDDSATLVAQPAIVAATGYRGVYFADALNGIAVGKTSTNVGRAHYTTDGGASWKVSPINITLGTTYSVSGAVLIGSEGWAVASANGFLLHTTDGGVSWATLAAPTCMGSTAALRRIIRSPDGWFEAVGQKSPNGLIASVKSGTTDWFCSEIPSNFIRGISYATAAVGYAGGNGGSVFKTANGGNSWDPVGLAFADGTTAITGLQFISETEGWAIGFGGLISHTTDAGKTWVLEASGTTNALQDIAWDGNTLWAVGSAGVILKRRSVDKAASRSW